MNYPHLILPAIVHEIVSKLVKVLGYDKNINKTI